MAMPQKGSLVGVLSIRFLQVESIFPVAYNEEKARRTSLCFLCSYVKSGRVYANTREKNVFSKPIEHGRACSNIVMARKRTFRGTRKERFR